MTPLSATTSSWELKSFLTQFYETIWTDEKRQHYQQERGTYPVLEELYQKLVIDSNNDKAVGAGVSYEDFWQRYDYRCDVSRVIYQLLQHDNSQLVERSSFHRAEEDQWFFEREVITEKVVGVDVMTSPTTTTEENDKIIPPNHHDDPNEARAKKPASTTCTSTVARMQSPSTVVIHNSSSTGTLVSLLLDAPSPPPGDESTFSRTLFTEDTTTIESSSPPPISMTEGNIVMDETTTSCTPGTRMDVIAISSSSSTSTEEAELKPRKKYQNETKTDGDTTVDVNGMAPGTNDGDTPFKMKLFDETPPPPASSSSSKDTVECQEVFSAATHVSESNDTILEDDSLEISFSDHDDMTTTTEAVPVHATKEQKISPTNTSPRMIMDADESSLVGSAILSTMGVKEELSEGTNHLHHPSGTGTGKPADEQESCTRIEPSRPTPTSDDDDDDDLEASPRVEDKQGASLNHHGQGSAFENSAPETQRVAVKTDVLATHTVDDKSTAVHSNERTAEEKAYSTIEDEGEETDQSLSTTTTTCCSVAVGAIPTTTATTSDGADEADGNKVSNGASFNSAVSTRHTLFLVTLLGAAFLMCLIGGVSWIRRSESAGDALCSPVKPGERVGVDVDTELTEGIATGSNNRSDESHRFSAPWWAPDGLKESTFELLCAPQGRSRTAMDVKTKQGGGGGILQVSVLNLGDDVVLQEWKRLRSLQLLPGGQLRAENRRGKVSFYPAPWNSNKRRGDAWE